MKLRSIFIKVFAITIIFVVVLVCKPIFLLASDPYDQRCVSSSENYINIFQPAGSTLSQTFTPTKNRLSRISAYLKGTGTGNFYFDLYKGSNFIASTSPTPEPNGSFYVSQYFSQDIVVYPGDTTYKIIPRLSGDNDELWWNFQINCYDDGIAYKGDWYLNNNPIWDFGFVTFGHDSTTEEPTAPDTSDEVPAIGDETSSTSSDSSSETDSSSKSSDSDATIGKENTDQASLENEADESSSETNISKESEKYWSVYIIVFGAILFIVLAILYYQFLNKKWPFKTNM